MSLKLPKENDVLPSPCKNDALKEFLANRRSTKIADIDANIGPDNNVLHDILSLSVRVPDHGKIAPWRFIVIQNEARRKTGISLANLFKAKNPNMDAGHFELESNRFLRAHSIIILVSSPIPHPKAPVWEQELSAGALGYNLILSANAHGFAATWLSEWPMFDDDAKAFFELEQNERIAGIFYIGGVKAAPIERERPQLNKLIKVID